MKAAIFDFDGTLFDSAGYWEKVILQYLKERGISPPENILSIVKPLGISRAASLFRDQFSIQDSHSEIVTNWRSQMGQKYHEVIPLKSYARQYIDLLKANGIFICLATAMERDFVMPALERTGIMQLFDLIVTIEDVQADKNSPKIFQYCAEYFRALPEECTVYEDSTQAAEVCRKAGFYVIGVFDGVCTRDCDLMQPFCDRFIYSFRQLIHPEEDYVY